MTTTTTTKFLPVPLTGGMPYVEASTVITAQPLAVFAASQAGVQVGQEVKELASVQGSVPVTLKRGTRGPILRKDAGGLYLDFDGTQSLAGDLDRTAAHTIVAVASIGATPAGQINAVVGQSSGPNVVVGAVGGTVPRLHAGKSLDVAGRTITTDAWTAWVATLNGASSALRVLDGGAVGDAGANTTTTIALGRWGSTHGKIKLRYLAIYPGTIPSGDYGKLEAETKTRWGVTA